MASFCSIIISYAWPEHWSARGSSKTRKHHSFPPDGMCRAVYGCVVAPFSTPHVKTEDPAFGPESPMGRDWNSKRGTITQRRARAPSVPRFPTRVPRRRRLGELRIRRVALTCLSLHRWSCRYSIWMLTISTPYSGEDRCEPFPPSSWEAPRLNPWVA